MRPASGVSAPRRAAAGYVDLVEIGRDDMLPGQDDQIVMPCPGCRARLAPAAIHVYSHFMLGSRVLLGSGRARRAPFLRACPAWPAPASAPACRGQALLRPCRGAGANHNACSGKEDVSPCRGRFGREHDHAWGGAGLVGEPRTGGCTPSCHQRGGGDRLGASHRLQSQGYSPHTPWGRCGEARRGSPKPMHQNPAGTATHAQARRRLGTPAPHRAALVSKHALLLARSVRGVRIESHRKVLARLRWMPRPQLQRLLEGGRVARAESRHRAADSALHVPRRTPAPSANKK